MKLIATITIGLPLLALATACGDGDTGAAGIGGDNAALKDQGAPFNSEPAAAGGTDASRRAAFGSTPTPNPADTCRESCGGGCGGICEVICFVCPNADLARCVSGQGDGLGEGRGNGQEGEGEDLLCEAKLQTCLASVGCPLDDFEPPQVEEGDF